jgi:hypothetical protein
MTIHWKALEEHGLMVPLLIQPFSSEKPSPSVWEWRTYITTAGCQRIATQGQKQFLLQLITASYRMRLQECDLMPWMCHYWSPNCSFPISRERFPTYNWLQFLSTVILDYTVLVRFRMSTIYDYVYVFKLLDLSSTEGDRYIS